MFIILVIDYQMGAKMRFYVIVLFSTFFFCSAAASAELFIVSNESVSTDALSRMEVEHIFLGKKRKWDDGNPIVCGMLEAHDVKDSFLQEYVKKSGSQFAMYWKKMMFTGKGIPPKSFGSEEDLIRFVETTNGAIGYLSKMPEQKKLKIIKILR